MSATCLRDEPGSDGDQLLTVFADGLRRSYTLGPPPRVGPALAEVMAAGTRTAAADGPIPVAVPERDAGGFLARLQGRRPRLALGAAVASLTFLGVGAAGALPGPAQSAFDRSADAVGITLPAAGTRDSTAPDAHDPDEIPGTSSSRHQDGDGGSAGEGAGRSVPVPPVGEREGAADGPAVADASASAGPALSDVDVPAAGGGRARRPHVEHPPAEDRPAPGPERGRQAEERGGPPSGAEPEVTAGPESRPGAGIGRSSKWYRPSWGFAREEPTALAARSPLGQEARRSAEESPAGAYPSRPSRR